MQVARRQGSERSRFPRRTPGFTLIETALATIIIGVGVLAMVSAQTAFHAQNNWSTHSSTATRLGNEIREMTLNLPRHDPVTGDLMWGPEPNESWVGDFDDLDDFDADDSNGWVFSSELNNGPISARREVIPNMEGWAQQIRAYNVDPFDIRTDVADRASDIMRVEVTVTFEGDVMTTVSWIAPK
ncbi:MAG: type IV pilus modification PilV family protein [Planctomycetota bacterium]|jgi:hypothetical protein